jgi:hypothetical protein
MRSAFPARCDNCRLHRSGCGGCWAGSRAVAARPRESFPANRENFWFRSIAAYAGMSGTT